MKKRLTILSLAAASLVGAACDEKARELAKQASAVLEQRSEQLSRKIAAEKAAYHASAALAARDRRELIDASLRNERNERVDQLAADYAEGRKPVSAWRRDLAEYA